MNKPIDLEYYVDSYAEVELRAKILKPFPFHHMLKFIGLNKKYNQDYVKVFYYNLVQTLDGLESRFKDKVIKFNYMDFSKYIGLTFGGYDIAIARSYDYDRISFVLSISKFVCKNHAI